MASTTHPEEHEATRKACVKICAITNPDDAAATIAFERTRSGNYTRDFYDVNGNFLFEDVGTLTATLLTTRN